MDRWQLWVDEEPRPGWTNMAIDTALLGRADRLGEAWLRLYHWAPHCLSFGRHEPATRRYNRDRIESLDLDTVRRPTGGRAVWHARELTYAVAAPTAAFGSLTEAYTEIHRMIADALAWLGVLVSLAPPARTPSLDSGACFSRPAGGEVMASGRKIVGSAQYRQGTGLLQHGSILLEDDQDLIAGVTRGPAASAPAPPLAELLEGPLPRQEVARSIGRAAAFRWGPVSPPMTPAGQLLEEASHHYELYRSSGWTWAR